MKNEAWKGKGGLWYSNNEKRNETKRNETSQGLGTTDHRFGYRSHRSVGNSNVMKKKTKLLHSIRLNVSLLKSYSIHHRHVDDPCER